MSYVYTKYFVAQETRTYFCARVFIHNQCIILETFHIYIYISAFVRTILFRSFSPQTIVHIHAATCVCADFHEARFHGASVSRLSTIPTILASVIFLSSRIPVATRRATQSVYLRGKKFRASARLKFSHRLIAAGARARPRRLWKLGRNWPEFNPGIQFASSLCPAESIRSTRAADGFRDLICVYWSLFPAVRVMRDERS